MSTTANYQQNQEHKTNIMNDVDLDDHFFDDFLKTIEQ
jgi:hypothetical protein